MPVALVHPGPLDTPTGGYAYDRRVLAELRKTGVDIAPLSLDGAFPTPSGAEVDAALARLAATPPDTLLLGDGLAFGALPADRLKALGRRLVALVHHPLALETGLSADLADQLFASEKAVLNAADAVVTVSPETGRTLVARYGVSRERLTLAVPGTEPMARVPADGEPPRLIAVGSLTPRKGYDILFDALDMIADLDFSLAIAGASHLDPVTAERVAARAAAAPRGNVRLLGQLDRADLDAAYEEADIFVHPSLYEGYGMVLAEAMRRGLPVVCTTGGAAGETVPDGAGLKVPPGDAVALAEALRSLIADPARRRSYADAAFAAGQQLPSWADTAAIVGRVLAKTSLT
ncbi:glycosyltransferase family 4 protein [Xanthobacter autotrophicus]|uniref:glycosyltransferase family 4 protein n=1 Tax=Xanthobacter TaxID=279 RepID=UPI0024AA8C2C|nr:glycosyltransferase family 4 protein [Xanthobacter autotrophicus]MDI4663388.1 glycosyltransferase family 4 protein [Xanthobacter autotrophicus]